MKIIVRDNLGKDITNEREWYINTDGKIFYYTGDIDGPLYVVDNDYTWAVVDDVKENYSEWKREYLGKWVGLELQKTDYPSCCDGCSNNPTNGGSGICNCTLPYMQDPIRYDIGDFCMSNNTNGYMYVIDDMDSLKSYNDNTNIIAEAVERTKKYVRK